MYVDAISLAMYCAHALRAGENVTMSVLLIMIPGLGSQSHRQHQSLYCCCCSCSYIHPASVPSREGQIAALRASTPSIFALFMFPDPCRSRPGRRVREMARQGPEYTRNTTASRAESRQTCREPRACIWI